MAKTLRIVGLGGSLARSSKSRAALQRALEGAAGAGAETQLLDLRELDLPMYNPDDAEPGEAAATVIESCYGADGLLWSSPMYQGTISGALKKRPRLAAHTRAARPAVPPRQGHRPDQRSRRDARPAGDQHDGVLGARTSGLGGAVRRSGRFGGTRLRRRRPHPGSNGGAPARAARERGRPRGRSVCGRQLAPPPGRVLRGGGPGRDCRLASFTAQLERHLRACALERLVARALRGRSRGTWS